MRRVSGARPNVTGEPSKCAGGDADRVAVIGAGQFAKVVGAGEHVHRVEVPCVLRLIPPRECAVEAALVSQDLLKGPEEVAVPQEELGVTVDVRHVHLVKAGEIFVAVRRRREVARRRLLHQAFDGTHEGQPVGGREILPFEAHVWVGLACGRRRRLGRSHYHV